MPKTYPDFKEWANHAEGFPSKICPLCKKDWSKFDGKICPECVEKRKPKEVSNLATFAKFKTDAVNRPAVEKYQEFIENDRGLFIYGNVGIGKSHLAEAVLNRLIEMKERVRYAVWTQEIVYTRDAMSAGYFQESEFLDQLTTPKYLIIDDLGGENITDYVRELFYLVLDRRIRDDKPKILITSNLNLADITDLYTCRVADRIIEICKVFEMKGDNYRKKINKIGGK